MKEEDYLIELKNNWRDTVLFFLLIFALVVLGFGIGALSFLYPIDYIHLNNATANEVCKIITSNTTAIAEQGEEGKLVCLLPSYDSTQNIIIKSNSK